jgi:hypothetical protein
MSFSFSFTKLENRRAKEVLLGGAWYQWEGRKKWGKGMRG